MAGIEAFLERKPLIHIIDPNASKAKPAPQDLTNSAFDFCCRGSTTASEANAANVAMSPRETPSKSSNQTMSEET